MDELIFDLLGTIPYPIYDDGHSAYVRPPPCLFDQLKVAFCEAILSIIQIQKPPTHQYCFKSLQEFARSGLVRVKSHKIIPPSNQIFIKVKPLFSVAKNGRVDWVFIALL